MLPVLFDRDYDSVDRLFQGWDDLFRAPEIRAKTIPIDILETEDSYVVSADLPGISKDSIILSVDKNAISISVEKTTDKKENKSKYLWRERKELKYQRVITLPTKVAQENIEAALQDGILTLTIKKSAEDAPYKIVIK
jgi:HSP20 family protein